MSKKSSITANEKELFRQAMRGVRRLQPHHQQTHIQKNIGKIANVSKTATEVYHKSTLPSAKYCKEFINIQNEYHDYHSHTQWMEHTISAEDFLWFANPGLQHRLLIKFKQGRLPIEFTVDLHGLNTKQAHTKLLLTMEQCRVQNVRNLLIIHGKGSNNNKPILKNCLYQWLKEIPTVLAFSSAKPCDGGTGALYVLLKREKHHG